MNFQKKYLVLFFCLSMFGYVNGQYYTSAESVEYDPVNKQWLVSNSSNIIADDGQGNLSFFGTSIAGFGMEVLGNVVYGATFTSIVAVDLTTQEELASIAIPGALFINGLTNDGESILYATDFGRQKIYKIDVSDLSNPIVETLIDNTIEDPNGIFYDDANNRLIYLTWETNAKIKAVDLDDLSISTLATPGLGSLDGIVQDNEGNYYVSSWNPEIITKFDNEFSTSTILETPTLTRPADIGYNEEDDILGIPMGENVIFIPLGEGSVDVEDINKDQTSFEIIYDLNSDIVQLGLSVLEKEHLKIDMLDISGNKVKEVLNQVIDVGRHSLDIDMTQFSSGTYVVVLTTSTGRNFSKTLISL